MAIIIPSNFDYKIIPLDPLEKAVRDELNINIENWTKFRHTIGIAADTRFLRSDRPIPHEIKESYLELGKSHYEVVTSLGHVKLSLKNLKDFYLNHDLLNVKKSLKEFYMHTGSVLDNLARLIYVINIKNSITQKGRNGNLERHSIGYGSLRRLLIEHFEELDNYREIIEHKIMNEIKVIRNNLTHSWPPATINGMWPKEMRNKEQYYYWPHDDEEFEKLEQSYKEWIPIPEMVESDWKELEAFQCQVFKKLALDFNQFEKNQNIQILDIE